MRDVKRLTITVSAASGHGVHALLPDEPCYAVVEVPGGERKQTGPGRPAKPGHTGCKWDEALDFTYEGGTPRALHVELHGQLPHGDDLVGAGQLDLHEALERGTKQVVEVPLSKGGRQLGALELCIQHQAMPGPS